MNEHKFKGSPKDDEGVKNEQVVEICEFIITQNWNRLHEGNTEKPLESSELQKILSMTWDAWHLATDVIDYQENKEEEKEFEEMMDEEDDEEDD
jgi:hypothetical protein